MVKKLVQSGDTLWQISKREGTTIPHLCHSDEVGYRSDGNCRACMVEIDGERTLAASCIRKPTEGMKVNTESTKSIKARKTVFELLSADQPARDHHPDPDAKFWKWADNMGVEVGSYPKIKNVERDISHKAMHVNLDACINCNLCVRDLSSNLSTAYVYDHKSKITFDFDDQMGDSSCVACWECVQVVLQEL